MQAREPLDNRRNISVLKGVINRISLTPYSVLRISSCASSCSIKYTTSSATQPKPKEALALPCTTDKFPTYLFAKPSFSKNFRRNTIGRENAGRGRMIIYTYARDSIRDLVSHQFPVICRSEIQNNNSLHRKRLIFILSIPARKNVYRKEFNNY